MKTIPLAAFASMVAVLLFLLLRAVGSVDPRRAPREPGSAGGDAVVFAAPAELPGPAKVDPESPNSPAEERREAVVDEREPEAPAQREAGVSLLVQVVDASGVSRAGVPVVLVHELRDGRRRVDALVHSAGPEGIARFPDALELAAFRRGARVLAGFGFPCADRPEVLVDPEALPERPIRLVLPETGSVLVHLEDPAGEPLLDGRKVWLERDGGEAVADHTLALHAAPSRYPASISEERSAARLFEHVGLGLALRAYSNLWKYEPVTARGHGPTRPGERVELRLRYPGLLPTFVGQAVDTSGAPVADRALRLTARIRTSRFESTLLTARGRSDGKGAFRLVMSQERPRGVVELVGLQALTEETAELTGPVKLPDELAPGEHDLGVVRLARAALLVGGLVQDDRGAPIRRASCSLQGRHPYGPKHRESWAQRAELRTSTDETGRFELRGETEPGEYRLHVYARGFLIAELPVALGNGELVVVLQREGTLEGSVLLGGSTPIERIEIRAFQRDERGRGRLARLAADGAFTLLALAPGSYEVRIGVVGDERPLIDPIPVEVRSGETERPGELQRIDLRGLLRGITVTVVDERERPVDCVLEYRGVEQETGGGSVAVRGGTAGLVLREGALDLRVGGPDFRTECFDDVATDLRVVLRRGILVCLELPAGVSFPDDGGYRLVARLQHVVSRDESIAAIRSPRPSLSNEARRAIFVGRRAEVRVPVAGYWGLHWTIERGSRVELVGARLTRAYQSIEVLDQDTPQFLRPAAPGQGELDRTLERLGRR